MDKLVDNSEQVIRQELCKEQQGMFKSMLSHYHIFHNASCVKCDAIHKEMVRVGAVVFCEKCVKEEFNSEDPVRQERERYLEWLHKSYEKAE